MTTQSRPTTIRPSITGTNQRGLGAVFFDAVRGGVYAGLLRPLDSGTNDLLVALMVWA